MILAERDITMKALSIRQPFAGMIAIGMKKIENRSRKTNYRGELVIHASKTWHKDYGPPDKDSEIPEMLTKRGCIIAVGNLVDVVTPEQAKQRYPDQEEYIEGPWCWVIENVQALFPIPYQGKPGLFEVNIYRGYI